MNVYAMHVATGRTAAWAMMGQAVATLTGFNASTSGAAPWAHCELSNVTLCVPLEKPVVGTTVLAAVWNPQSSPQDVRLRLPVGVLPGGSYKVAGPDSAPLIAQIIPLSAEEVYLRGVYHGTAGVPMQWLAFVAPAVPPMGYSVVFITPVAGEGEARSTVHSRVDVVDLSGRRGDAGPTLTNGIITLTYDGGSGALTRYSNTISRIDVPFTHDFAYYNGSQSTNYMFGPHQDAANAWLPPTTLLPAALTIITGPIVNESYQVGGGVTSIIGVCEFVGGRGRTG